MNARRWGAILMLALLAAGCAAGRRGVNSLPPEDREFLSEVRYLISKKERQAFLSLAPEERPRFIEEFWKLRDPSPGTDENEFRDQYYNRIDQANRLFREGSSGWTTDRGRVFIMLGPPERRVAYPAGYTFYDRPMEFWYYHLFTIIFVDETFTGVYKLDPQSAQHMGVITAAQAGLRPDVAAPTRAAFDFSLRLENAAAGLEAVVAVPYRTLYLLQRPGQPDAYETTLTVSVEVVDAGKKVLLRRSETLAVVVQADQLQGLEKEKIIRLPLELEPGRFTVLVTVANAADRSQVSKQIESKP